MISTKHPAGGDEQGSLEGFQVDINEQKRRADFVFCRPPFNIIPTPQHDQLRWPVTFELARSPRYMRCLSKSLAESQALMRLRSSVDFRERVEVCHAKRASNFKGS